MQFKAYLYTFVKPCEVSFAAAYKGSKKVLSASNCSKDLCSRPSKRKSLSSTIECLQKRYLFFRGSLSIEFIVTDCIAANRSVEEIVNVSFDIEPKCCTVLSFMNLLHNVLPIRHAGPVYRARRLRDQEYKLGLQSLKCRQLYQFVVCNRPIWGEKSCDPRPVLRLWNL